MTLPNVAVVVATYNAADNIARQLSAIYGQLRTEDEIVVVDDASTDTTFNEIASWCRATVDPRVTVLRAHTNGGGNVSHNAGVLHSSGELVVFVDGDDTVCPGWLEALRGDWEEGVLRSGLVRLADSGQVLEPGTWFGLPTVFGGNMAIGRHLLEAMGGFDESIRDGGPETEFAIRAQLLRAGRVELAPRSEITYQLPTDALGMVRRAFRSARGQAYLALKFRAEPLLDQNSFISAPQYFLYFTYNFARMVVPARDCSRRQYLLKSAS